MRRLTSFSSLALTLLVVIPAPVPTHAEVLADAPASVSLARADAPAAAPAGTAAGAPVHVRTLEGISEYRLDNGLQVLLLSDPSKATITVNITYRVGSQHENYGETGMAHLLEHMVFKGTPTFPDVAKALNGRGGSYNGTTWTDRTNYFETMAATEANLEFGLKLEADRMVNSFVRKSDLDSEMTVVRNEFELGENFPTTILSERMMSSAFLFHGYGHSTIGAKSDLEGVPIERLQAFYRTFYQPDNALLILAGRFDEKKALASIQRYFGPIPRPERKLPPFYTLDPAQDGERTVTLRRVGEVGAFGVLYHQPGASHPDAAVLEVVGRMLGESPAGRLYKAVVESKKAVKVAFENFLWKDPGALQFMAEVRKDQSLDEVRDLVLSTIEGFAKSEVDEAEVARARNTLLKEKDLLTAESERFAIELSEWAAMGDWRLFFVHRERLKAVDVAQVREVAGKYLVRNNRTAGTYIPSEKAERVEIPATPDVQSLVAGYTSSGKPEEVDVLDLDPATLEAHTLRTTLPNGMRLAMLPKQTRQDRVVANLRIDVATEKELLQGKEHLNRFVAEMLLRGTKTHTRAQIKEELDRRKAQVKVNGAASLTTITLETTRENLPAVAALVTELVREPAFDAGELELLRQETLAKLEEALHEPLVLGQRAVQHHLYPKGHISYMPTVEEEIALVKGVTLEQLRTFHQHYYGAALGGWAVVGDFDPKEVEQLARNRLGDWKSEKAGQRVAAKSPKAAKPLNGSIMTPDKTNALVAMGAPIALTREHPDYAALLVANHILGGEGMSARLGNRVRQKEGLSYGVWSFAWVPPLGDAGVVGAGAIMAPQNAAKVEAVMLEELNRAIKEGFSAEEVTRAKAAYLQREDVEMARDSSLAGRMVEDLVRGETFKERGALRAKIDAVDAAKVNAALRKYFDPKKLTVYKAGDLQAVGQASATPKAAAGGAPAATTPAAK